MELPPSFRLPETPPKYMTPGTTIKVCPKTSERQKGGGNKDMGKVLSQTGRNGMR